MIIFIVCITNAVSLWFPCSTTICTRSLYSCLVSIFIDTVEILLFLLLIHSIFHGCKCQHGMMLTMPIHCTDGKTHAAGIQFTQSKYMVMETCAKNIVAQRFFFGAVSWFLSLDLLEITRSPLPVNIWSNWCI